MRLVRTFALAAALAPAALSGCGGHGAGGARSRVPPLPRVQDEIGLFSAMEDQAVADLRARKGDDALLYDTFQLVNTSTALDSLTQADRRRILAVLRLWQRDLADAHACRRCRQVLADTLARG